MSQGSPLPPIPAKRYFTIGEVAQLCCVKPHVLRYWEQEFTHLRPVKRRGNRRYYQHHELLMIRRIRELLYDQGFTIQGARNRLRETGGIDAAPAEEFDLVATDWEGPAPEMASPPSLAPAALMLAPSAMREELLQIRELLTL
ncbi:MerR family transcriptional regulator [Comamonas antarctica]|uniref:MerR family transcriptional regulator n=2 Tax=Comamonas antarctica TaxID=2743470 RepID=A0A6N1X254_9BURK|nr:MerR family transcriptional regulator [Comamonas antarctica]QKV53431.1 MerR family transcriptional regulator [Comamonas antarctica]